MAQVPIEELLKRCGSVYKLTLLAARRAKELADGAPALVEHPQRKVTSLALEEILQGKVFYQPDAEAATGRKGRGTKTKAKTVKKRAK